MNHTELDTRPSHPTEVEAVEDGVYPDPSFPGRDTREWHVFLAGLPLDPYFENAFRQVEETRWALRSGPCFVVRPAAAGGQS